VMDRTPAQASLTDKRMWRRLLARVHPDTGGSEELFVWTQTLREELCGNASLPESVFASRVWEEFVAAQRSRPRTEPRPKKKPKTVKRNRTRIPFDTTLSFDELTDRALEVAATLEEPYSELLPLLLEGCELPGFGCDPAFIEKARTVGAYYARLADVGHALGFDGRARGRLYRFAKQVPLSDLHAVHITNRARRLAHDSPKLVEKMRRAACRGD
jgi:hypothetical protein